MYFTINAASNTLMKQFYPDEEILIRKVLFKFKFTVLSLILKSDGCDLFCINYKEWLGVICVGCFSHFNQQVIREFP